MKKQTQNQIFKSVLLLLSVIVVLVSVAVVVFAADSEEAQTSPLELIFEDGAFKCYIETRIDANSPWETYLETQVGGTFQVPYGEHVRLRAVANMGEWADFTVDSETVYNVVNNTVDNTVEWTPYKKKATVTIARVNRTYTILPLNYDQGNGIGYATLPGVGWSMMDWKNGIVTITYQYGAEPLTQLPPVKMEDHIFKGWNIVMGDGSVTPADTKVVDGETQYFIPKDLSRTSYFNQGIIYVYPDMEPLMYPVYRQDVVFDERYNNNRGELLFGPTFNTARVNTYIYANATDFWSDDVNGLKQYAGYQLLTDLNQTLYVKEPPADYQNINTVYRYYLPIVYNLRYNLNDNGDATTKFDTNAPETYTYASTTHIGKPTRAGYTFQGWKVEIYTADKGWVTVQGGLSVDSTNPNLYVLGDKKATYTETVRNDPNAIYASEAQEDGTYEIRLTADWKANEYSITYKWGDGVSADLIQNANQLPIAFTFDQICTIPNPVRAGYTFAGWILTYADSTTPAEAGLTAVDGAYQLNGALHAKEIILTASWQVKDYTVNLNGNGATNAFTNSITGVIYDAVLVIPGDFTVPVKTGYTFVGYYNADGSKKYINADGTSNCDRWDIDGENGTVTLYAKWEINYYNVVIDPIQKVPAGVTITVIEADGTEHPYTEGTPVLLPYQTEFRVEIELPKGFKIVTWNGEDVEIHSGNTFVSPLITLGDGEIILFAEAVPAQPNIGAGEDVDSIIVDSDTSIKVNFASSEAASRYEVAISRDQSGANLNWNQIAGGSTYYLFNELDPGTIYYVFIRLKETETTNSGLAVYKEALTRYDAYVNETIANLNGMFTQGDGEITKAVIQETVEKIEALRNTTPLPEDFYEQIEALIAEIEEKLVFARFQDAKIAALEAFLDDCFNSGSFSTANKALLQTLCSVAVGDISIATTQEAVDDIYSTAMAAMKAVPVTYLYDATQTMQLTTLLGLGQNGSITLNSIEDIKALRRAISDAIAAGKITADSFITLEQATELLRALDVVSAYNFYLVNVQPVAGDSFEFRMLIPEALAGRTGLQVAYYNAATGMVELLETTIEGNMLVFRAKQVADFVILADPTVDLSGVIIALGIIVLCQLIAIALVLSARSKAKNAVQHASIALPVFLTIYFQPANSEMIALALGALVLILQIVLMWLLISSGMIRVIKPKKSTPPRQKAPAPVRQQPVQTADPAPVVEESTTSLSAFVTDEDEASIEEEYEEDEEMIGEGAFDEELAEELSREQAEEAEEVYEDEEFIEAAPNPYYSLDDEEDEYAYIQEETERVSDVDATDQETEETSYDTDPIEGVFGDTYVQDGSGGDEGADSYYAEQGAGSYVYADEETAAQFYSEEFDREETGDERSVDPTAYIVNEDEISEEEEMYRYDE